VTMVTVGVLMYAADGNSSFYWKLLDGLPMVGPLVAFDRLPVVLVVVGGCIALVSFLGCCGACEDSVCFLCVVSITHTHTHTHTTVHRVHCMLQLSSVPTENPLC